MKTLMTGSLLAAAFGTALAVVTALPAAAQLAHPQTAIGVSGGNDLTTNVQFRGRGGYGGGWRGGYGGGWRGGYGGGWRGGYRGRYYGPGIGLGLGLGLATGALIGGALATPYYYAPAPRVYYEDGPAEGGDAVTYCMQRFRSYDPASGTYLGFDGARHPCP